MRPKSRVYTLFGGDMRPKSRIYTLFGGGKIVVSPNGFDRWGRARKTKTLSRP